MSMYMLELMYAPTDWLTLMVMPTYMNMDMQSRGLLTPREAALPPDVQAMYTHHTSHQHTSGGIGDTGIYALFGSRRAAASACTPTLGVTAPTGDVAVKLRDTHQIDAGFDHYGMQLGSGTWDFNPSMTYLGSAGPWFWGAQASAIVRMENRNASGYALGNVVQATAWGGYAIRRGLSATLRGVYTRQGAIRGEFNGTFYKLSPVDYPANYGGRFWDLGVGLRLRVQRRVRRQPDLASSGCSRSHDDFNGYQLERRGALYATWQYDVLSAASRNGRACAKRSSATRSRRWARRASSQLFADDAAAGERAITASTRDVERLEQRYSRYRDTSLLSQINRVAAAGGSIEVDDETAGLLDYAATCYRESDGLFDITSGLLRTRLEFRVGRLPEPAQIEALLAAVGWDKVRWEPPLLSFPIPGMEIDFGGIVKEYAADRAAALCREARRARAGRQSRRRHRDRRAAPGR